MLLQHFKSERNQLAFPVITSYVTSCKDMTGNWQLYLIIQGTELDPHHGLHRFANLFTATVNNCNGTQDSQMQSYDTDKSEMNKRTQNPF